MKEGRDDAVFDHLTPRPHPAEELAVFRAKKRPEQLVGRKPSGRFRAAELAVKPRQEITVTFFEYAGIFVAFAQLFEHPLHIK